MFALLQDAGSDSIRDTRPESLALKCRRDQLRALAKDRLYDQFSEAIDLIWSNIERWQQDNNCLLGEWERVPPPPGAGSSVRWITLLPLSDNVSARIRSAGNPRHALAFVSFHVRLVWKAFIEQWSQMHSQGQVPSIQVPPLFHYTSGKSEADQFLWSGVNTAMKVMFNSLLLLRELYDEQHGESSDSDKVWRTMIDCNQTFVVLLASANLTTFVELEKHLDEEFDPDFLKFLIHQNLIGKKRAPSKKSYEPYYKKEYFRLVPGPDDIFRLDLAPNIISDELRQKLRADVLNKKCPALKIGVVGKTYDWLTRLMDEYVLN